MSTVDVQALAEHAREYGFAYLITISRNQRIHTSVVHPEITADAVTVPGASGHAVANAAAHAEVSLVWPPIETNGYSLIVDGTATLPAAGADRAEPADGADAASGAPVLAITPSRAILHRPAAEPSAPGAGDGCVQDCIEF